MEENTSVTKAGNIVLVGMMGAGKTTIGEHLARHLGFGFLDTDRWIEKNEKMSVAQIFAERGEDYFRQVEKMLMGSLQGIRHHVIATGGGSVTDDDNWETFARWGRTVWLKTPATEIARRIVMNPDEIRKRPLVADLVEIEKKAERHMKLAERFQQFETQRAKMYGKAQIVVEYAFATPDACAHFLVKKLKQQGTN